MWDSMEQVFSSSTRAAMSAMGFPWHCVLMAALMLRGVPPPAGAAAAAPSSRQRLSNFLAPLATASRLREQKPLRSSMAALALSTALLALSRAS